MTTGGTLSGIAERDRRNLLPKKARRAQKKAAHKPIILAKAAESAAWINVKRAAVKSILMLGREVVLLKIGATAAPSGAKKAVITVQNSSAPDITKTFCIRHRLNTAAYGVNRTMGIVRVFAA